MSAYHRDPLEANPYPDRGDGPSIDEPMFCEAGEPGCAEVATVFFYDGEPHRFCGPCYRAYVAANTQRRLLERC